MRLLPRGTAAQMETTYRWRCGVGRGWSLSRCLDPAWTSCTAIFKAPESQQDSEGHRVEVQHTGLTVLLAKLSPMHQKKKVWKNMPCCVQTLLWLSRLQMISHSKFVCNFLDPKQIMTWRLKSSGKYKSEIQFRLQRSSCLRVAYYISLPSVGWKWFLLCEMVAEHPAVILGHHLIT